MYLYAYEKNSTAYKSENDVSPLQLNCINNNKNSTPKLTFESENDDKQKMRIKWGPDY